MSDVSRELIPDVGSMVRKAAEAMGFAFVLWDFENAKIRGRVKRAGWSETFSNSDKSYRDWQPTHRHQLRWPVVRYGLLCIVVASACSELDGI